ncbi:hypothetical protein F5X99DRAFT_370525 [Biscogniauxia marginata]|nr:hypothetical protein F5X99DRAFT_370525 [Biscogniauxia marginata]
MKQPHAGSVGVIHACALFTVYAALVAAKLYPSPTISSYLPSWLTQASGTRKAFFLPCLDDGICSSHLGGET